MKLIISPYSRKLGDKKEYENPKNYVFFDSLVQLLRNYFETIYQVGTKEEKKLDDVDNFFVNKPMSFLCDLIKECDYWVSVDNFFQHLCWYENKPGCVIFSQGDPRIFGHKENLNILKDRKYLRPNQYALWEFSQPNFEAYEFPKDIYEKIQNHLKELKIL